MSIQFNICPWNCSLTVLIKFIDQATSTIGEIAPYQFLNFVLDLWYVVNVDFYFVWSRHCNIVSRRFSFSCCFYLKHKQKHNFKSSPLTLSLFPPQKHLMYLWIFYTSCTNDQTPGIWQSIHWRSKNCWLKRKSYSEREKWGQDNYYPNQHEMHTQQKPHYMPTQKIHSLIKD